MEQLLTDELIAYWSHFRLASLARLNLSFVPMMEMLERNRADYRSVASFGSGSCSHEVSLGLMKDDVVIHAYDATDRYIPDYTQHYFQERPESYRFHLYDFSSPPLETFDLVFSIQTLEHVQDYENALDALCQSVAPGGFLYVDTPLFHEEPEREPEMESLAQRAWEKHEHYHLGFSRRKTEERLRARGFRVVDSGFYCYRHFDQALLEYIRGSDSGRKTVADEVHIRQMVRGYGLTLTGAESAYRDRRDELDAAAVSRRLCYAIRVLAMRPPGG